MAELRPLLDEYERLLEAADTLASIEAVASDGPSTTVPEPQPQPPTPRRDGRDRSKIGQRGSAAGAIELASRAPEPVTQAPEPTPPAPRAPSAPRILPGCPRSAPNPDPALYVAAHGDGPL